MTKAVKDDDCDNVQNATRKAATGTLLTIALRLLSFVGTQWCYRRLDPDALGKSNIRLELQLTSILFLSREGFRLALTRQQAVLDTAWLTIPLTTLLSGLALIWHLQHAPEDDQDYQRAGILYCLAAAIEGWAEPPVLYYLQRVSISEKATAEGIAVLVKTACTVLCLQYILPNQPVSAFGMSQIAYAVTYFIILYGNWFLLKRDKISWSRVLHSSTLKLIAIFTAQGLFKFGLTEGDRIVMTFLSDSYNQGVYAMGSSYGGLAARMLLQPLEESARLLFGRFSHDKQSSSMLELSYISLVKAVLYVGLIFSCLAVNYTTILLNVLAGRKWGSNPEAVSVLSAFCIYTSFLAWNGMTEAFVYGVASSASDVGKLSVAHTITGVLFAVFAPLAVAEWGTVGLVAANCIAMLGRAVYATLFASDYLAKQQGTTARHTLVKLIAGMFPSRLVLIAFSGAYYGSRTSMNRMELRMTQEEIEPSSLAWFRLAVEHIAVGASLGIGVLTLAFVVERDFRQNLRRLWHGKTD